MALSDLAVFQEYVYTTQTEVLAQQIDLFNAASNGVIQLKGANHQGDFHDEASFKKITGLIRRRDPYGSGAVTAKKLENITDRSVKIAAGTPPIDISPSMFKWIAQDPKIAGAVIGKQMAGDTMADMLNTALMASVPAIGNVAAAKLDASGETSPATLTSDMLNRAAYLFGDSSQEIAAWVLHSKPMGDFYGKAIANAEALFSYDRINVLADPFGRRFIVTDASALVTAGSPNKYNTLGLVNGAIQLEQNADFTDNIATVNGDENISKSYQAEWSFQLGIKGYAWDKDNGGKAPNDAALATATNWDKYATSVKDTAGVLLITK